MAERRVPRIRFKGFEEDWEQRKVSELADRYDNLRVPVAEKLRVRGTTPYYGANGIQDYVRGFTHDGEFVLVAEDGANDLKNYPVQYVNGRIWVNNHAHVLQAKDKIADTRFLGYAVSRADIEAILVGGGRAKLNAEVLMRLALILPGRTEQIRLASFLVGIDSLLSLHQRKLEKLKILKKAMLEKMFPKNGAKVPEIRFSGFTEDWEQRKLKELANRVIVGLATSVTPYYREQGVPILRNLNIKENHLDDSDLLYLDGMYADKQNSKKIRTGDVLTVHTGYIGTSCVVPPQYDNCLTFTTLVTTTNSLKILGDFLSQYLNSQFGMLAVQMVTTQGGRQNLNTNDFVQVEMSYPFIAEQKKICEILSTLDSLLSLHHRQCLTLAFHRIRRFFHGSIYPGGGF